MLALRRLVYLISGLIDSYRLVGANLALFILFFSQFGSRSVELLRILTRSLRIVGLMLDMELAVMNEGRELGYLGRGLVGPELLLLMIGDVGLALLRTMVFDGNQSSLRVNFSVALQFLLN